MPGVKSQARLKEAISILRSGGVGVLPTDTLYGIVGSALSRKTVQRIYTLRKRNPSKPMIVLISDIRDLKKFGVFPPPKIKKILQEVWPGKVSVVLHIHHRTAFFKKFSYLDRGTAAIAFRLPKPRWLRELLCKTGPLVAPSANLEGLLPAKTISAAKKYFSDKVDFYFDAGRLERKPSKLIVPDKEGEIVVLRK